MERKIFFAALLTAVAVGCNTTPAGRQDLSQPRGDWKVGIDDCR